MSSKAYSTSTTADNRAQPGDVGGQFVAGGATVFNPGALGIQTGQLSTVSLSGKYAIGMSGSEVAALLGQQSLVAKDMLAAQATAANKLSDLATTALQTQSATPVDWQRFIPYIVFGVVAVAVWGKGRRKAA
jgi:hypothetical protein